KGTHRCLHSSGKALASGGVLDPARLGKLPELEIHLRSRWQRSDRCDRCLRMDDGRKPPDRPKTRRTCDRSRRLVADAEKVLDYSRQLIEESQRLIKESRRRSGNAPASEPKRRHGTGNFGSWIG